jgi:hypothetical protein
MSLACGQLAFDRFFVSLVLFHGVDSFRIRDLTC